MARQKKKGNQSETVKSIAVAAAILGLIRELLALIRTLVELITRLLE